MFAPALAIDSTPGPVWVSLKFCGMHSRSVHQYTGQQVIAGYYASQVAIVAEQQPWGPHCDEASGPTSSANFSP